MPQSKILIIDDEEDMLEVCSDILRRIGQEVSTATDAQQGLKELQEASFDLVIVDFKLPGMGGMEVLKKVKDISPETLTLMITAYPTIETAVEAVKQGAFDYITKPFSQDQLEIVVRRALAQKNLAEDNRFLRRQLRDYSGFKNIVGKSEALHKVFDLVRKVAEVDCNVLILGESGTGKELIARSIHAHSVRKDRNFVPVCCGALPEELLESELFGHEKGAFTGAHATKIGLFEYAHGGTFFLDDVCELPLSLQVKLLRALQERQIRRVGGQKLIDVNVRIISATNMDIHEEVENKRFREDLYYRLKVVEIPVPPLRQRKEDIPLLAEHFLEEFNKSNRKLIKGIHPKVIDLLMQYPWPGNIRELENIIERAYTIADHGSYLMAEHLPSYIMNPRETKNGKALNNLSFQKAKKRSVQSFEVQYVQEILEKARGNVTHAAIEAGLHRTALLRLMKKHRIHSQDFKK